MLEDAQSHHRRAVQFWGDDISALFMEARPGTPWFEEVCAAMDRAQVAGLDPLLEGADIGAVMADMDMDVHDLAARLEVPFVFAFALEAGWCRLSTRGLLVAAERLGVPVGAFVRNEQWQQRVRVRLYRSFRMAQPEVKHLD